MKPPSRFQLFILALAPALPAFAQIAPRSLPLLPGVNDAATLAPKLEQGRIADQWRNEAYGLVLHANGGLAAVYRGEKELLLTGNTWYLQGQYKDAEGKTRFKFIDEGENIEAPIDIMGNAEGHRVYDIRDVRNHWLTWSRRVICTPTSLRVETTFTPHRPAEEGVSPNLFHYLKIKTLLTAPINQPNDNPITLLTPSGQIDLSYSPELRWYNGYFVEGDNITFSPLLGAWEVGRTYSVWYQLDF